MGHNRSKALLNAVVARLGARVVNAEWGPRGWSNTLTRIRELGFAPKTVIDIGASNGQWTRQCLPIFPEAKYLLVDPLPENQPSMKAMAEADQRINFWSGAIGPATAKMEINHHGDQSSFLPSKDFSGHPTVVDVRPLDSFLETEYFKAPILLKADVQGYELEVLKSGPRTLAFCDVLLLEVSYRRIYEGSPLAHEVITYISERDFHIYDVCSYIQRPSDSELVQSDLVFVRSGSPLWGHDGWN